MGYWYMWQVDGPWKYANWKKPDTKGHVACFLLYEIPKRGKSIETECRLVVSGGVGVG